MPENSRLTTMRSMGFSGTPTVRRHSLLGWTPIMLLAAVFAWTALVGMPARRWLLLFNTLVVLAVIVWAVLQARRDRHRYEEELARQAASHALAQQRLDLARGVHDALSHRLGAITMRAALAQRMPDRVAPDETLKLIETISRAATDDLRGVLDALGEAATTDHHEGETAPPLDAFVDIMERAGLTVELRMNLPDTLPSSIDRAASSLIREALSNCLRHAGPVRATVEAFATSDDVQVRVYDDGPQTTWRGAPGTGHGLATLREQITALGGEMEYGPHAGGGWQVQATLPLRKASS